MAYTVNQSTTGVQGAADDLIYVVLDTVNTGSLNYRYVCVVMHGATELMRLKQLPNNATAAVFNISSLVSSYVQQDANPYSLGVSGTDGSGSTVKIFSSNEEALKTFTVKFGYELSATAADQPATTLVAVDQTVICVNGTFLAPTAVSHLNPAGNYKLAASNRLFLSDIPTRGTTYTTSILFDASRNTQRATLAFLNGDDVGSTGSGFVHVTYYNGATALNTGHFINEVATGGAAPAAGHSDSVSLLYVGVGTYNLDGQTLDTTLRPDAAGNGGWTHYDVQMASSSLLPGNETSEAYRFIRVACGQYILEEQLFSLHWWNSKGGVDSLPMLGKLTESQDVKKSDYRTSGGNSLSANGSTTDYEKFGWEGGKRGARVQTETSFELSTIGGDVTTLTPMIRSIMNSERVFLSGNSGWGGNIASEGVVQAYVTDPRMTYLSGVNNQAESYKLNVQISRRRVNP